MEGVSVCVLPLLARRGQRYLVVEGGDEPKLRDHVTSSSLSTDEVQQVFMSHPVHVVDLQLVLP